MSMQELGELSDTLYFESKLERETDPVKREKIKKQLELLNDAIIIYHETLPPRYTDEERKELEERKESYGDRIYNPLSINEDYIFPRSDDVNLRGSCIETLPTLTEVQK